MNTVYLVWEIYHDESELIGIYSTREKAEKVKIIEEIINKGLPIYWEIEEKEVK